MAGFTKLFNSILYSTIWQEPNETRILWITLLAMSDSTGEIHASIPGLAKIAGISIAECENGLLHLSSPDTYSRTPDHEGRRLEKVDGGWRLLNHGKYRKLLSAEERKEYNRKKQADHRAKKSQPVTDVSPNVNDNKQCQHITEAEAEAPPTGERATPPQGIWKDEVPTSTANQFEEWTKRINSMHPKWRTALIRSEMDDLMANAKAFASLEEQDWKLLAAYMDAVIPEEWGKFWQPDRRSQFIRSISDILGHADKWEKECRIRKVSTGIESAKQHATA